MLAAEFGLWASYRDKFGFDIDRLEWAVANGASAQCHAWGARLKAEEVIPKFGRRARSSGRTIIVGMANLPGALVMFVPKDPSRPTLTGLAAMEEFERAEEAKKTRATRPTLDGKGKTGKRTTKPEKPRPRTLSGD